MKFLFGFALALLTASSFGCQSCTSGLCGKGLWGGKAGCADGSCGAAAECSDGSCGLDAGRGVLSGGVLHGDRLGPVEQLKLAAQRGCDGTTCGVACGPTSGAVTYPYYTMRGPRDFFLDNPPTIGR